MCAMAILIMSDPISSHQIDTMAHNFRFEIRVFPIDPGVKHRNSDIGTPSGYIPGLWCTHHTPSPLVLIGGVVREIGCGVDIVRL